MPQWTEGTVATVTTVETPSGEDRTPIQPIDPHWSRTVGRAYGAMALLLVPWIIYLGLSLPSRSLNQHYALTWVGFDVVLLAALARTSYLALRRRPLIALSATATSTLLLVDAWFDVTTASTPTDRLVALAMAFVVELPLSALSAVLAHRAHRRLIELAAGSR